LLLWQQVYAHTLVLTDFDDVVLETRESFRGTFKTKFKLYRINYRANVLQRIPDGDEVVDVSPIDLHRMMAYLGKGNLEPGNFPREQRLENGMVIRPGEYMLRSPDSFEYFMEGPRGVNYLLNDFKEAEASDPEMRWKGPFWDTMVEMLSRSETANQFGIITARGHSREEWEAFFKYLKKRGYIKCLPNLDLIHGVSLPHYDQFGVDHQIATQKTQLLEEVIQSLGTARLENADQRLHPNGKESVKFHYVVFAENNQLTLDSVTRSFQHIARSRRIPVKLGVFNFGNQSEVADTQRPQYAIVQQDGTFRHATEHESIGEPIRVRSRGRKTGSCGSAVVDPR